MLIEMKKNLKSSFLPGLFFTIFGLALQIGKSFLLMKNGPPTADFIIKAAIVYYLISFFFCFGFFTFQNAIPGKSRFKRAFRYSLASWLAVLLPGIIGVIAFDFKGGSDLLSPEKINDYAITVCDTITFLLGGTLLGFYVKDKDSSSPFKFNLKLLISCLLGAVVYPMVQLLLNLFLVQFIDYGYSVPNEMKLFHFASAYGTLILTGLLLPVLFSVAANRIKGSRRYTICAFSCWFFVCLWMMNIAFLIPLGFPFKSVLLLWMQTILSILVTTWLSSLILGHTKKLREKTI